jgi:hypothetical protein
MQTNIQALVTGLPKMIHYLYAQSTFLQPIKKEDDGWQMGIVASRLIIDPRGVGNTTLKQLKVVYAQVRARRNLVKS